MSRWPSSPLRACGWCRSPRRSLRLRSRAISDSQPLFVRLPSPAAEQLNRIVEANGASKREIVTRLILGEDLTVGQHDFHPNPAPSVLTVSQAAEMLQIDEHVVVQLAESGTLPARRLGGQWRFSRGAVLEWLGAGQNAE